ncbi:transposable element Tcb1 transposase [Trichonephila clavipes]|nr:transposable element Tcb1 transposase [Trichonephila clavipes]
MLALHKKVLLLKLYYQSEESINAPLRSYYQKKDVEDLLHTSFGEDRVLSHLFRHARPPRSPDINLCVYWLWGYLEQKVYRDCPNSSGKDNILR